MKKSTGFRFVMLVSAMICLTFPNLSCKKAEEPKPEASPEAQAEPAPAKSKPVAKKQETHESPKSDEPKQEETAKDDEKVDSVKGAFQYTGKEMEKGFKKSGSSMKKFFVGDDEKK